MYDGGGGVYDGTLVWKCGACVTAYVVLLYARGGVYDGALTGRSTCGACVCVCGADRCSWCCV